MRHARNPPPSIQEKPVTTDTRPFEEMNTIAKQIKEQALVVTDDYFRFLKKTISSHPARGSEVGDVLKSHAETQRSEGFSSALRAQTEFMQSQFVAFGEQTKTPSEVYSKSAANAFNTFKNVA
jgi:hypothetical protein